MTTELELADSGLIPTPEGPADMAGSFRTLTVFEVLQLVAQIGSGTLLVEEERVGSAIVIGDGDVHGASRRHLRDQEAVLDLLTTKQGSFRYWKTPGKGRGFSGTRRGLQDVLLESARLEDELELRSAYLPPEEAPLRHRSDAGPSDDPLDCRAPDVFAAVRGRTGVTRLTLEQELPMAAVRVRLGLATLVQGGHLRERRAESFVQTLSLAGVPSWYLRLLGAGNGLRVLVGVPEGFVVEAMVSRLASELGTDPPEGMGLTEGPVFARIRPPAGGLVAITIVALSRRNRFLFPTLSRGVELVVVADTSVNPKELDARARVLTLTREELSERSLVEAVRWVAEPPHGA